MQVTNLAGHKLPTAYPSRRVWLHVQVRDAQDRLLLASGRCDAEGRLIDALNQVLPSEQAGGPTLPHYHQIERSDQVQVYESLMADTHGAPTFRLLRGARYLKDNRLLPRGWHDTHAEAAATAPAAVGNDPDFAGGSDTVFYVIPATTGPLRVQTWLYYQVLSPRYADELFTFQTPEVQNFQQLYRAAPPQPALLATAARQYE